MPRIFLTYLSRGIKRKPVYIRGVLDVDRGQKSQHREIAYEACETEFPGLRMLFQVPFSSGRPGFTIRSVRVLRRPDRRLQIRFSNLG